MKCILIDDEPNSLELLAILIEKYCTELKIIGQYVSPKEGIDAVWEKRPDLVFLDVDMPEINGFGVLDACRQVTFQVIFTTAYHQYAVDAFRYSATDYLLKPIEREELRKAVDKAMRKKTTEELAQQREILFNFLHPTQPNREKIAFPTSEGAVFMPLAEIEFCEAKGNYCMVYTTDNPKGALFVRSLREVEEMLKGNDHFIRTHNSFLVNLKKVKRYIRGDGDLEMSNDKKVPIARPRKKEVLDSLGIR